jgi:hypothetical protein
MPSKPRLSRQLHPLKSFSLHENMSFAQVELDLHGGTAFLDLIGEHEAPVGRANGICTTTHDQNRSLKSSPDRWGITSFRKGRSSVPWWTEAHVALPEMLEKEDIAERSMATLIRSW